MQEVLLNLRCLTFLIVAVPILMLVVTDELISSNALIQWMWMNCNARNISQSSRSRKLCNCCIFLRLHASRWRKIKKCYESYFFLKLCLFLKTFVAMTFAHLFLTLLNNAQTIFFNMLECFSKLFLLSNKNFTVPLELRLLV